MTRKLRNALVIVAAASVLILTGTAFEGRAESDLYRLGVAGSYNPRSMYLKYQPFVDYLTQSTGNAWELHIGATDEQTIGKLCRSEIEAAFLEPFAYVRAKERCGVRPVVQQRTGGQPRFQSCVLVRENSDIKTLRDLEGRTFGFGPPLSTSSHLMPRAVLIDAGVTIGTSFCLYYSHHDQAARRVLLGDIDACGMQGNAGRRYEERGLRVIARSKPLPTAPLVLSPGTPDFLGARLVDALVHNPTRSPRVARRFTTWDVDLREGFSETSDAAYEPVRQLARRVFGDDALKMTCAEIQCGLSWQ